MFMRFGLCILIAIAVPAWAQLDSASAVLLRPSGANVEPEDLDSSRYKIRAPESKKEDEDLDEKPGSLIPSPVPPKPKKAKVAPPPVETANPGSTAAAAPIQAPAPAPNPAPQENPPVAEQVRELILGGSNDSIEEARKQIHPDDPRSNVINISIAPAYFYEDSQSNYSFRRYVSNGPGFGLGMSLWLTPFFGLQSNYFSSVTASVRSGPADVASLEVQAFSAGLRFRKHFGYSRKAAQISYGLDYHDGHDKISRDATSLIGSKSNGVALVLQGELPTSITYAHTFDLQILPRLHHSEQETGVSVRPGGKVETNALSLSLGGQWTLDRSNQMFWKGQYNLERSLYQGSADTVDPHNGLTPNGVSITESLVIFYFGFRWGS